MITLKQLRYLDALARHRHFGRAAESCAVTQSALSQQIQLLEQTLGRRLVDRAPGRVGLTSAGAEIARRARLVLDAVADLVDFARQDGVLAGSLRLGVIPTIAPYLLPDALPRLAATYPRLRLELRESVTEALVEALAAGELDVVLAALPLGDGRLETLALFDDPFLLAVAKGSPWAEGGPLPEEIVRRAPLLLLEEGHCLRDQALSFCSTLRADLRTRFGASSLATIVQLVANGYGATLLPQMVADAGETDERIALVPFPEPAPRRTIGLAWRRASARREDYLALGACLAEGRAMAARANDG